ncbi:hypothetical protein chiPu_0023372 [Chiloscyllium punctatum]|uniref:Uncharacterized protein n=1 Tax=Chiloscyllium punctatum TaxID=137246 RepID=A0A401T9B6_CHIPU|nr:hypothetical protein [Chiloscyllium punctatum]
MSVTLVSVFLGSELLAARILHARKPLAQCQVPRDAGDGDYNEILKELQPLCQTLGMAEPTRDTPVPQLFRDLETKVRSLETFGVVVGVGVGGGGVVGGAVRSPLRFKMI